MTVASLWKALDEAGCGQAVGEEDIIDPQRKSAKVDPWTYNERQRRYQRMEDRPTLAVDLSIWICESLTSTAMNEHNENPTVHLVFTRTMKLLTMGIKLIYVIEGKRRIRCSPGEKQDKFRRRRSGTSFWKACKQCEELLGLLGVPVVRAKAEGEALCALLNQQGIVDGVISNDGDCLLFGAKAVYTKFSLENLEKGCVMRYDASRLYAIADATNNDEEIAIGNPSGPLNSVLLSREDLIAFALLTGSDLAGDGLSKVGHKKAVRFIRKCRNDYPLSPQTAAIEELKSWARSVSCIEVNDRFSDNVHNMRKDEHIGKVSGTNKKDHTCCSRCDHVGSKRSHEKNGCELCGTQPGEPCYKLSSDDKFRKSLRRKALAMTDPKFDPALVVDAYLRPNDNQLPASILLSGMSSSKVLKMGYPRMQEIVEWPIVVKGHCLAASREYVKQSVARLLARTELFQGPQNNSEQAGDQNVTGNKRITPSHREKPIPKEVVRKLVQNRIDCYEVRWAMNATMTDDDGEGIDGYEFLTIEPQDMILRLYPKLISSFHQAPKEFKKQGDAETQKRREFLELMFGEEKRDETSNQPVSRRTRKEDRNFLLPVIPKDMSTDRLRTSDTQPKTKKSGAGDDVEQILRFAKIPSRSKTSNDAEGFDFSSIESENSPSVEELGEAEIALQQLGDTMKESELPSPKEKSGDSKPLARKLRKQCSLPRTRDEDPPQGPERRRSKSPTKNRHFRRSKKKNKKRSRNRRVSFAGDEKKLTEVNDQTADATKPDVVGRRHGSFQDWDDMSSITNGDYEARHKMCNKQRGRGEQNFTSKEQRACFYAAIADQNNFDISRTHTSPERNERSYHEHYIREGPLSIQKGVSPFLKRTRPALREIYENKNEQVAFKDALEFPNSNALGETINIHDSRQPNFRPSVETNDGRNRLTTKTAIEIRSKDLLGPEKAIMLPKAAYRADRKLCRSEEKFPSPHQRQQRHFSMDSLRNQPGYRKGVFRCLDLGDNCLDREVDFDVDNENDNFTRSEMLIKDICYAQRSCLNSHPEYELREDENHDISLMIEDLSIDAPSHTQQHRRQGQNTSSLACLDANGSWSDLSHSNECREQHHDKDRIRKDDGSQALPGARCVDLDEISEGDSNLNSERLMVGPNSPFWGIQYSVEWKEEYKETVNHLNSSSNLFRSTLYSNPLRCAKEPFQFCVERKSQDVWKNNIGTYDDRFLAHDDGCCGDEPFSATRGPTESKSIGKFDEEKYSQIKTVNPCMIHHHPRPELKTRCQVEQCNIEKPRCSQHRNVERFVEEKVQMSKPVYSSSQDDHGEGYYSNLLISCKPDGGNTLLTEGRPLVDQDSEQGDHNHDQLHFNHNHSCGRMLRSCSSEPIHRMSVHDEYGQDDECVPCRRFSVMNQTAKSSDRHEDCCRPEAVHCRAYSQLRSLGQTCCGNLRQLRDVPLSFMDATSRRESEGDCSFRDVHDMNNIKKECHGVDDDDAVASQEATLSEVSANQSLSKTGKQGDAEASKNPFAYVCPLGMGMGIQLSPITTRRVG